jgi:fructose-bisphosphate aldolase, class II
VATRLSATCPSAGRETSVRASAFDRGGHQVGELADARSRLRGQRLPYDRPRPPARCRRLGTGERGRYLLAATFGNVHGVDAPRPREAAPRDPRPGAGGLAAAHPGARFQYVFHGSSGSSDEDIRAAISYGVVKINLDSDAQYALTRATADHMLVNYAGVLKVDGGIGDKRAYDPRAWGRRAEAAMAARVSAACELFGSAGRSLSA